MSETTREEWIAGYKYAIKSSQLEVIFKDEDGNVIEDDAALSMMLVAQVREIAEQAGIMSYYLEINPDFVYENAVPNKTATAHIHTEFKKKEPAVH